MTQEKLIWGTVELHNPHYPHHALLKMERVGDVILILLESVPEPKLDKNLFAYDLNGSLRWQYDGGLKSSVSGFGYDGGKLLLHTWSGFEAELDPLTGQYKKLPGRPW